MTIKKSKKTTGILLAILAAALYTVNSPFSKLLLDYMPSTLMAGFLYIGSGVGMGVIALIRKTAKVNQGGGKLTKSDLPYTIAMVVLDIAAPIFLLLGLSYVWWSVFAVLGVGFVAYGLSIFFYVYAQRLLGAARTSAYYAVAPFIGVLLSLLIFGELPGGSYYIALICMAVGAWLCAKDEPLFRKKKGT
jgi:drug/metabolite transporter (DMT)-like permease